MLVSQAWNGGHVVVTNQSRESWTSFLCKALFRLYWIGFRADTNNVTIQYSKNSNSTELKRSGWPNRVWWTNPNPHSWIFTSIWADASSPFHLFTSATVRIPVHIAPKVWHGTYSRSVKSSFSPLQKSGRNRCSYVWTSGGSRPSDNGGGGGGGGGAPSLV